ncbi:hypothetical protein EIP91_007598 [Steccherinum ochraceum]|uniref:Uncharacterized protein n=1 Tax=Steccherinum ochraceum TaxID=92696 RepID=A0A4R0RQM7_9APHY|nr:hypothetical protein EIP91_007598 [Steccherinum ochraceum]
MGDDSAVIGIAAISATFIWEFVTSLDFEWSFLRRRKMFTWPIAIYFAGRYFTLITVCLELVQLGDQSTYQFELADTARRFDCRNSSLRDVCSIVGAYEFFSYGSDALATANLAIRMMALWSLSWWIVAPMLLGMVGHWGIVIWNTASFSRSGQADEQILPMLLYSVAFDAVVFFLTMYKLWRTVATIGRNQLSSRLTQDGFFWILAILAINLSIMFVRFDSPTIGIFPAAVVSSMLSGRLVRRVSNFRASGPGTPALYLMTEDTSVYQPANTRHLDLGGATTVASPDADPESARSTTDMLQYGRGY